MNEIRVWESLAHENIVPVFSANILPVPYVEMEYMPHSLSDCMDSLNPEQKKDIIYGVLEGLSYAHEKGISHLDLKPANILLNSNFKPKIADWGLSDSKLRIYSSFIKGFSYPYIAPEQKEPLKYGPMGPWTDVYIMGLLIREIFIGEIPENSINYIRSVTGNVINNSADLAGIIKTCLMSDPRDRFQDACQLLQELKVWLNN